MTGHLHTQGRRATIMSDDLSVSVGGWMGRLSNRNIVLQFIRRWHDIFTCIWNKQLCGGAQWCSHNWPRSWLVNTEFVYLLIMAFHYVSRVAHIRMESLFHSNKSVYPTETMECNYRPMKDPKVTIVTNLCSNTALIICYFLEVFHCALDIRTGIVC